MYPISISKSAPLSAKMNLNNYWFERVYFRKHNQFGRITTKMLKQRFLCMFNSIRQTSSSRSSKQNMRRSFQSKSLEDGLRVTFQISKLSWRQISPNGVISTNMFGLNPKATLESIWKLSWSSSKNAKLARISRKISLLNSLRRL